jgi:hypothetical protein
MRDVRYKHHPGVGGPSSWQHGSLLDLLRAIPYLLDSPERKQPIPPRYVLNQLLALGKADAGMSGGCEWKPFELADEEYRELVDELLTKPDMNFIEDATLSACQNMDEWRSKVRQKYRAKRITPEG